MLPTMVGISPPLLVMNGVQAHLDGDYTWYLIDGGEEDDHRSMSGMVSHYKQYRNVLNGDPEHLGSVKLVPLGDTLGGGVSLISHHLPCGLIMLLGLFRLSFSSQPLSG